MNRDILLYLKEITHWARQGIEKIDDEVDIFNRLMVLVYVEDILDKFRGDFAQNVDDHTRSQVLEEAHGLLGTVRRTLSESLGSGQYDERYLKRLEELASWGGYMKQDPRKFPKISPYEERSDIGG